ncbi:MAG: hypothetical protein NT157_01910 [Candidatus Micrarchaeota archaeon]|nr:hypothetical protein [Candidatus Micrarchaeota archaeon]
MTFRFRSGPFGYQGGTKTRETRPREQGRILNSGKLDPERAVGPSHGEIKKVTVEMWNLLLSRGSRLFAGFGEVELNALKTVVKAILSETEGDTRSKSLSSLRSILTSPNLNRDKLLKLADQTNLRSGKDLLSTLDNFIKTEL